MAQGPTGREPRFSDDQNWYWDGAAWIPAAQAPVPPPPPSTPPPSSESTTAQMAWPSGSSSPAPAQPVSGTPDQPDLIVGNQRWDGQNWVPITSQAAQSPTPSAQPAPGWVRSQPAYAVPLAGGPVMAVPQKKGHMGRNIGIGCGGLIGLLVIVAIASSAATSGAKQANSSSVAAVTTPSATSTQTTTSAPKSPAPSPSAPAPVSLSGTGSKVLTVTLAQAPFRVSWNATGHDNMIVHIRQGTADEGLINQIPPDPSSGQEFFDSPGGNLIVEVQAATLAWNITFTQIVWPQNPSPTPKAAPISLQGQGSKVTDPMYVPAGNYKLAWTAQGHDNFIVHVVWSSGSDGLVNEIPPDPASGETVFFSGGAEHSFVVDAATLTWTITLTPI